MAHLFTTHNIYNVVFQQLSRTLLTIVNIVINYSLQAAQQKQITTVK